jgi:hypothetical protein
MPEMKPHGFERPINDGGCDRCGMGPEHRWHLDPPAQDLGERFDGERCKRHGATACPSCLTYTVRDLQDEVRRLRGLTRGPVAEALGKARSFVVETMEEYEVGRREVAAVLLLIDETIRALPDEEP